MMRLVKKLCTWKIIPVAWTAVTIFLLCIPGSAIPSAGVFATEGIDKVVHAILFGGIVLLWGFNQYFRRDEKQNWQRIIVVLTFFSVGLGIGLEFLQRYYIPNRSFDGIDIIADSAGAIVAAFYHWFVRVR
ncbi:VanZ family protein [Niastella caeni]|uniref:VanZ family protein n=1 Tax=Niastella caeni TaxID=2569763 RepID=A0A4S8HP95_9BACT|nr:VanZ family protein [Niastella caeni]THU37218.1 VanZ family protein [Niastella caeni]